MNVDLGYQNKNGGGLDVPCSPKAEKKMVYPCLSISVKKGMEDLLDLPKDGTATITYRVKRLEIGEADYPPDEKGRLELEITSLEADDSPAALEDEMMGEVLGKMDMGGAAAGKGE